MLSRVVCLFNMAYSRAYKYDKTRQTSRSFSVGNQNRLPQSTVRLTTFHKLQQRAIKKSSQLQCCIAIFFPTSLILLKLEKLQLAIAIKTI